MQPRGFSEARRMSLPELDWLFKILKDTVAFSLQSWNACALFHFVHQDLSHVTVWFWCRTTFKFFFKWTQRSVEFVCFVLCTSGRMAVSMVTRLCATFAYVVAVHCVHVSSVRHFSVCRCSFHIKTEGFVLKWVINCAFFLLLHAGVSNIRLFCIII